MCRTLHWKSEECGHTWLELEKPCGCGMNLLTCPDFSDTQPFGPADKPRRCYIAAPCQCPRCDYDCYDMRKRRMIVVKRYGWRFGAGPGRRDLGFDVVTHRTSRSATGFDGVVCCAVM